MKSKKIVGILCGGKSAEHEISLLSAKNIIEAIDRERYEVKVIGIDKSGKWHLCDSERPFLYAADPKTIELSKGEAVTLPAGLGGQLWSLETGKIVAEIDVIFPILHGPYGEDGTVQGLLKLANVAFVGAGVLGSAAGMDKDVMKRLLRDAAIPVANFRTIIQGELVSFIELSSIFGLPLFIKPANMGSSVGVSKVKTEAEFTEALESAFCYDSKVIIEEYIKGKEIECAVLGNENPITSELAEIVPTHDFYSYEAKYLDENGATLQIPAKVPKEIKSKIQQLAIKVFKVLECEGLGRVDFFLKENGDILVIEINTMPGFTKISMFPTLWGISGFNYSDLIDKLIQLGLERSEQELKCIVG